MSNQAGPLITFALFAYNQEKYIREAVGGALAQTYSPLQIILSDDCSSDKTFEIMREVASQYEGPHQIVLNRNQTNLGIGQHINKVMSLAEGGFIIVAAGDDISMPQRTEVLVKEWIECREGAISVHSTVQKIDEMGRVLGYKKPTRKFDGFAPGGIIGASHGWSKKLFSIFGELETGVINEDQAIGFRAMLLDGVHFIDKPLVKYRLGGFSASSPTKVDDCMNKRWNRWIILTQQHLLDVRKLTAFPRELEQKLEVRASDYMLLQELACSRHPYAALWAKRNSMTFFLLRRALNYLFPRLFRVIQSIRIR